MTDLPARGERVTILWPGGDHDFVMDVRSAHDRPGGLGAGWVLLNGALVEPYRDVRDFCVRRTEGGGFSLLPKL